MMNSLFGNVDQHAMTLLFVTLSGGLGLSFGRLHFKKISFGISGVLFAGILLASLKIPLSKELLTFCKDFGLSLFVYTIGLQVGPSFFGTARKEGLVLNILAAVVVLAGVLVACAFGSYLGLQK